MSNIVSKNKDGYGYKSLYKSPTYQSWDCMKQRCKNKNNVAYNNYGGRGINFPKEWETFENFVKDMGIRPDGTTLDRINVNENYSKENCRWATKRQQQHNMRVHKRKDVGVTFSKERNKWVAKITNNYKQFAKRFETKEEAIIWRKEKEKELWEV